MQGQPHPTGLPVVRRGYEGILHLQDHDMPREGSRPDRYLEGTRGLETLALRDLPTRE